MAGGTRRALAPGETLQLLALAIGQPRAALARAHEILADDPAPWDGSVAHQVVGIVLRDFGDVGAGIAELRVALRLARRTGSSERQADVLATLGAALVMAGRTPPGLASLEAAAQLASGVAAGRVLMRRGATLLVLGRHREALDDLRRAVAVLRRAGDTIWEPRALSWRSLIHLALGSTDRADADLDSAERLFAATSQELESAYATHNRGLVAFRSGDLPVALSYLDEAAQRYKSLDTPMPDLSIDRCAVLLAAGLPVDALGEADMATRDLERLRGQATKKAELLLAAASAALAAAEPQAALERARAAQHLFGTQQRIWWHARAALLLLQARYAAGAVSGRLLGQAERAAARLDALHSTDALQAHLLAGRIALELGRQRDADRHLTSAARGRRRGAAMSRASGWLAEALRAEAAGDSRRLVNACRRGLDVLDEHQLTLGASELRAQATAQGAELAALAQRHALRAGRPRNLLAWSERWRSTALAIPPVRPVDDRELQVDLAAVRDVTSRLEKAQAQRAPVTALQREQQRLENAIRARVLRARGTGHTGGHQFDAGALLDVLGPATLIQIVNIDGALHLLVCGGGRVRHFTAGRADDATREVDFARFSLRRLAHKRGADRPDHALAVLDGTGRRLEDTLLGATGRYLRDGPVVIVPPGRLHAVPWALLPSLRDRAVSVAPSARAWMRAHAAAAPDRHRVALVRGPGLGTGGAEIPELAAEYDDVTTLGCGTATAAGVLEAIDGAWLAHIAAHGTFRADSPLFSSLLMDDGPLTVYDVERLRRAPYRLVLSSCDSGLLASAGADELLGLTSTMVPLGTVGIVASVVPVNDNAAVPLMLALHRRLRRGGTLGEALRDARGTMVGDPVGIATGSSFVALGAG